MILSEAISHLLFGGPRWFFSPPLDPLGRTESYERSYLHWDRAKDCLGSQARVWVGSTSGMEDG